MSDFYFSVEYFGKNILSNISVNQPVMSKESDSANNTPFIQKLFPNMYTSGIKKIIDFNIFVIVDKYAFQITLKAAFHINNIALNIKNIDKK